jgi:hypothetical protein
MQKKLIKFILKKAFEFYFITSETQNLCSELIENILNWFLKFNIFYLINGSMNTRLWERRINLILFLIFILELLQSLRYDFYQKGLRRKERTRILTIGLVNFFFCDEINKYSEKYEVFIYYEIDIIVKTWKKRKEINVLF